MRSSNGAGTARSQSSSSSGAWHVGGPVADGSARREPGVRAGSRVCPVADREGAPERRTRVAGSRPTGGSRIVALRSRCDGARRMRARRSVAGRCAGSELRSHKCRDRAAVAPDRRAPFAEVPPGASCGWSAAHRPGRARSEAPYRPGIGRTAPPRRADRSLGNFRPRADPVPPAADTSREVIVTHVNRDQIVSSCIATSQPRWRCVAGSGQNSPRSERSTVDARAA